MNREQALQICAARASGGPVSDVDLVAAQGVLAKPPRRKKLPRLANQKQIDDQLASNLANACRKVA